MSRGDRSYNQNYDGGRHDRGHSRGRGRGGDRHSHNRQYTPASEYNYEANWHEETQTFEEMGLPEELVNGIYGYGFQRPSNIQKLAVKPITEKRHIIAQAQSGTGKTGAFGIGILANIKLTEQTTQALILAPTRELTDQIYHFLLEVGNRMEGIKMELYIGGTNQQKDEQSALELPHIAVCTPGRALALIESGSLRTEHITMVCLDEADRVLDDRFREQIQSIFEYLNPGQTQFLMFSATYPPSTIEIMTKFMPDPIKILVRVEELTLEGIEQFFVNVTSEQYRWPTLLDLYGVLSIQKAIIFANSKNAVDTLQKHFQDAGFNVAAIHAGMEQTRRNEVMKEFRLDKSRVLISTDLLARGIDVQQITLVVNYEVPYNREQYIHRIGRSGRHGRKGVAINFCTNEDLQTISELEQFYRTAIKELPSNIGEIMESAKNENETHDVKK